MAWGTSTWGQSPYDSNPEAGEGWGIILLFTEDPPPSEFGNDKERYTRVYLAPMPFAVKGETDSLLSRVVGATEDTYYDFGGPIK